MPTLITNVKAPYRSVEIITDTRSSNPTTSIQKSMLSYGKGTQSRMTNSNPNWQIQVAQKTDAGTPYRTELHRLIPGYVDAMTFTRGNGYTITSSYYSTPHGVTPSVLEADHTPLSDVAVAILKRKLRSSTGQMNALVPLAELKDLRSLLRGTVSRATMLTETLLSIRKTKGKSAAKYASDTWLNFSFGIAPTLSAVNEAVDSVNKYFNRQDRVFKDFAYASQTAFSSTLNSGTGPFGTTLVSKGSFKWDRSCKLTAAFKYNLRSGNNYSLGDHLGLHPSSLVSTAWELLPYSWLIDYFTTAGSFFDDVFSADFGQSIYISRNMRLEVTGTISHALVPFSKDYRVLSFLSRPTQFHFVGFTRSPLQQLPRAPFRFKTFDEIGHNATSKLLNLASLLGSRLK